jgi:hypothetical protein
MRGASEKNPRLGTRDQPRRGRERSRSHTSTHWQVEGLGGPLYTCLRRAGGRGDNSVGYPTVPRRRTEQVVPFLPLPPSTRFARCACARKHAPTRTPPIAGRAMQAPAKLQARVWTEAYNLTYASTGLRTNTPSAIPPVNVVSPEPRRSPSRGSLSGWPRETHQDRKSPARAGLSKQGVGIVSPTRVHCPNEDVGIGTAPRTSTCGGTRDAHPAFSLHGQQGARPPTGRQAPVRRNCEGAMPTYRREHPGMRVLTGVIIATLPLSACSGSSRVEHVVPAWANTRPASQYEARKPPPDASGKPIAESQPTAQPAVPQPAVRNPAAAHGPSEE